MKPKYSFKEGSRLNPRKAPVAGRELDRLRRKHGQLNARLVVDEAEDPKSPLHEFFEWNHKKAADQYRLEQGRHLIRHVVVFIDTPQYKGPTKAFVTFDDIAEEAGEYIPICTVMSDEAMCARMLKQAFREHRTWEQRYKQLEELMPVFKAARSAELKAKKKPKKKGGKKKRKKK